MVKCEIKKEIHMNFDEVKNFMDRLTAWRIPGNSITVYKDNKKVFEYSSGYSDLEGQSLILCKPQNWLQNDNII